MVWTYTGPPFRSGYVFRSRCMLEMVYFVPSRRVNKTAHCQTIYPNVRLMCIMTYAGRHFEVVYFFFRSRCMWEIVNLVA